MRKGAGCEPDEAARQYTRQATLGTGAKRNFTDPDSRSMQTAEGFVQGYNAQAAVDAASQIIVAHRVKAAANDRQQLSPVVAQVKRNSGRQARELSANAGYSSEANF